MWTPSGFSGGDPETRQSLARSGRSTARVFGVRVAPSGRRDLMAWTLRGGALALGMSFVAGTVLGIRSAMAFEYRSPEGADPIGLLVAVIESLLGRSTAAGVMTVAYGAIVLFLWICGAVLVGPPTGFLIGALAAVDRISIGRLSIPIGAIGAASIAGLLVGAVSRSVPWGIGALGYGLGLAWVVSRKGVRRGAVTTPPAGNPAPGDE